MNHLKIISLLAMAAASLMAFAGSASAATFTSPTGTEFTGHFSMSLEGSSLLKAAVADTTCTSSTMTGSITTNNATHATGQIETFSFSNCTSPQGTSTVLTLSGSGTITIANGTRAVSATGTQVTEGVNGVSCVYGFGTGTSLGTAANTEIETVKGSEVKEDRVTLAISTKLPKIAGGFLCANPADWSANYVITSPSPSSVG